MKKFFQKLACISIALAGLAVSSCTVEKLETAFKPASAVATIEVTVYNAVTGEDVTAQAEIGTTTYGAVATGNVVTIVGTPDISKHIVYVKAIYNGEQKIVPVTVAELRAGGKASYSATIIIGTPDILPDAVVRINMTAYDLDYYMDVTDYVDFAILNPVNYAPTPITGSVYTITGTPDIKAQKVYVAAYPSYAPYKQPLAELVNVAACAAGKSASYVVSFVFDPTPVIEPAKAIINMSVVDLEDGSIVTENCEFFSNVGEIEGNEIYIEGNPDIKNLEVIFYAKYDGRESEKDTIVVDCENGCTNWYSSVLEIPAKPVIPVDPVLDPAKATIFLTAVDQKTGNYITDSVVFLSTLGTVKGNEVYIVKEDGIPAQEVTITAYKENGQSASTKIKIGPVAADSVAYYAANILFPYSYTPAPAEAQIKAVVYSEIALDTLDASAFTLSAVSDKQGTIITVDGDVITLKAAEYKIPEQTITVTMTLNDGTAILSKDVTVLEIPADAKVNTTVDFLITNDFYYDYEYISEVADTTVGQFFSPTHGHMVSHAYSELHVAVGHGVGTANWLTNLSEFILNTTITFNTETGIKKDICTIEYETCATPADKDIADKYFNLLATDTYKCVEDTLHVQVSAFAIYTAYGVRTITTKTYYVYRILNGIKTHVATLNIKDYSTSAEYVEAAAPGHEGHDGHSTGHGVGHDGHAAGHGVYHYGHGAHDIHGLSNNAGGGIIYGD